MGLRGLPICRTHRILRQPFPPSFHSVSCLPSILKIRQWAQLLRRLELKPKGAPLVSILMGRKAKLTLISISSVSLHNCSLHPLSPSFFGSISFYTVLTVHRKPIGMLLTLLKTLFSLIYPSLSDPERPRQISLALVI